MPKRRATAADSLQRYREMRSGDRTPEPFGGLAPAEALAERLEGQLNDARVSTV